MQRVWEEQPHREGLLCSASGVEGEGEGEGEGVVGEKRKKENTQIFFSSCILNMYTNGKYPFNLRNQHLFIAAIQFH